MYYEGRYDARFRFKAERTENHMEKRTDGVGHSHRGSSGICGNTEYVHYLLQHSKSESAMDDGVNVTAQPALSLGGLNNLPFLLPSSEEQDNITKFLSYETA